MKNKPIIILNGEPNSIFLEIFFKSLKNKNYKSPIILVSSYELIKFYMKKLKFNKKINLIDFNNFNKKKLVRNSINLINVKFKLNKNWNKISKRSNKFIYQSFDLGLKLLNKVETYKSESLQKIDDYKSLSRTKKAFYDLTKTIKIKPHKFE